MCPVSIPYRKGRNLTETPYIENGFGVSIPYRKGRNSKQGRSLVPCLPCQSLIGRVATRLFPECFISENPCQSLIGRVATTVLSTVSGSMGLKTASFLPFFPVTQYTIFEIVFQHIFTEFRSPTRLLSPKSPC